MTTPLEKFSAQQRAKLRVCASCEWIFKGRHQCPKCGFAHYGARFVYGDKAYRYAKTQKPWHDKKMSNYSCQLLIEIKASQPPVLLKIIFEKPYRMKLADLAAVV